MEDIMHKQNLALLLDFLNANSKEGRENFFHDNRKNMDTLAWYYWDEFKKGFYNKQRKEIEKYYSAICKKTKTEPKIENRFTIDKWRRFFYNRVLYIYLKSNENGHRIGIECVFEDEDRDNPLGKFHIYIASWAEPHFRPIEQKLREAYPENHIYSKFKNRLFLPVAAISPEGNEKTIISILKETYDNLKKILDEHQ